MSKKLTLEYIKKYFLDNNCEFIDDEYKNARYAHNYVCDCGNKSKTRFDNFKRGKRCSECGDNKKYTLEYVKDYFTKNNCEFLDNKYINNHHPHNYICNCGNKSKTCFVNFKRGARCMECSGTQKYNLEYIRNYFSHNGCVFLDNEYINNHHPHNYICSCGNKSKTCFINFKRGARCMECGTKKSTDKQKHTLEYVKNYFLNNGCVFLDEEYINAKQKHNYICLCKNKSMISFDRFQKGNRCMKCGIKKSTDKQKHTLEYVKNYFLKNNCEFLDNEYINNHHPHNYICSCGNKSKTYFANFKNGNRCRNCSKNGFNTSKPSFVYLVGNHYKQKIGIAGENTDRLKTHIRNFGMELIDKIDFSDGDDAIKLENNIKKKLKIKKIPHGKQVFNEHFDGVTESWLLTDLEVKTIAELINL